MGHRFSCAQSGPLAHLLVDLQRVDDRHGMAGVHPGGRQQRHGWALHLRLPNHACRLRHHQPHVHAPARPDLRSGNSLDGATDEQRHAWSTKHLDHFLPPQRRRRGNQQHPRYAFHPRGLHHPVNRLPLGDVRHLPRHGEHLHQSRRILQPLCRPKPSVHQQPQPSFHVAGQHGFQLATDAGDLRSGERQP